MRKTQTFHPNKTLLGLILAALAGCQSLPAPEQPAEKPKQTNKVETTPAGVVIHPYDVPEIGRKAIIVPEQKKSVQKLDDGRSLPAFQKLMQQTQAAYASGKLNEAESAATQAQRLAPQSAETYLYLAMIANRKNQPANAEALAKRGVSYAQSSAMKKQLWQTILKAGQQQKKNSTINQALTELKRL